MFDSKTSQWTKKTSGPVSYQGGSGIYHKPTNSLRFLTGYPVSDSYMSRGLFTFEYSISSGKWAVLAKRTDTEILYQSQAFYLDSEVAIIHGGLSPDSITNCFQSKVLILDLACNTWATENLIGSLPRKGHATLYRNGYLHSFGGADGVLNNDIIEIPFAPKLQKTETRDYCRGIY
jgi:hypothetical protein